MDACQTIFILNENIRDSYVNVYRGVIKNSVDYGMPHFTKADAKAFGGSEVIYRIRVKAKKKD